MKILNEINNRFIKLETITKGYTSKRHETVYFNKDCIIYAKEIKFSDETQYVIRIKEQADVIEITKESFDKLITNN